MTTLEEIIRNWQTLSRGGFDDYIFNNKETLIREEKEQIVDAYDIGYKDAQCNHIHNGEVYYNETYQL